MEKYTWITGDHEINLYYYTYIYIYYIYYITNQTGILSSIPGQVAMWHLCQKGRTSPFLHDYRGVAAEADRLSMRELSTEISPEIFEVS